MLYKRINQFISHHNLIKKNDIIIIGLSGGPDSVFLTHFLVNLREEYHLTLIATHLNHEWRPEAQQEEQLCQKIAENLGIQYISSAISQLNAPIKLQGSQEEYGRKVRRYFFGKIAKENNATSIALAHHLQDQEETFFIRLIRGSSLTGLTGMHPHNGLYIRPLLEIDKSDILAWLDEHTIAYATDISNISEDFLRNRIRSKVIPALQECDQRFDQNFLTTLNRLKETENFLQKLTAATFQSITTHIDNKLIVNLTSLWNIDSSLYHRILIHWLIIEQVPFILTQSFLDEILRFLHTKKGGAHTIHEQWKIVKKQNNAFIEKL